MGFQLKTACLLLALVVLLPFSALAQDDAAAFRSTELPLPRFASLRSDEIYVRTGPGQRYPVEWVYKKGGLPVEIILEFDIWRKIKDYDGQVGWVHHTMLSGKRTAFIKKGERAELHKKPLKDSQTLAFLDPNVIVAVSECAQGWCAINASGYKGWVTQNALWGVYESEEFD
jgi:SH3-like domain-containing protein